MSRFIVLTILLNTFVFWSNHATIFGQTNTYSRTLSTYNTSYSTNNILFNGRIYLYPYGKSLGTPYLFEEGISHCTVFHKGKAFPNRTLFLDIYTHDLILDIKNKLNAREQIIVRKGTIDSLYMDGKVFIYNNHLDKYMELIYNSPRIKIFSIENKTLRISKTESNFEFLLLRPRLYYKSSSLLVPLKTKYDFLSLVSLNEQKELRKRMRQGNFSIKKPRSAQFKEIMTYISSLK